MNNKSKTNERAEFLGGETSADAIRKRFIEAPTEAAQQPAINAGLELLAFMSALPEAFLASEQRELKRLARTSDNKNDARIERLKASIERATEWHATSLQGKARIDRAVASLSEGGDVFHGFVSDTELQPRKGLTVRISDTRNEKTGKSFSATTDADGYFSIVLGKDSTGGRSKGAAEADVKLSDRMAELLSRVNAKNDTAADANKSYTETDNQNEMLMQVEILGADKALLYQDPSSLVINSGKAYREYVIDGNGPVTTYEPGKADSAETAKPREPNADKTKTTATKPVEIKREAAAKKVSGKNETKMKSK